jgi:hypothetical protein
MLAGIALIALFFTAGSNGSNALAQSTGGSQYFPETSHWVSGPFLDKYNSVREPEFLFGYPITEEFYDPISGLLVQYFQRTRFELHPEAPPELQVQLSYLGEYLYNPNNPLPVPPNFPACRYFAETGKEVCYAFLDFFEQYGGVAQFGYPISNFELQEGRIVQYFQRARFEWHPEQPYGQKVTLTNLGRRYFEFIGEDPSYLESNFENNFPRQPLDLRVHAFGKFTTIPLTGGKQILYVIARDQNMDPLPGANVAFTLQLPGEKHVNYIMSDTNDMGVSISQPIPIYATTPGGAEILITVTYKDLTKTTRTSFHIWW